MVRDGINHSTRCRVLGLWRDSQAKGLVQHPDSLLLLSRSLWTCEASTPLWGFFQRLRRAARGDSDFCLCSSLLSWSAPGPPPLTPQKPFPVSRYLPTTLFLPLITTSQPLCETPKVLKQRILEHIGKKELLVISASLPSTNLPETMNTEIATCWTRRKRKEKLQRNKKSISRCCWLTTHPYLGQDSDQAAMLIWENRTVSSSHLLARVQQRE